MTDFAAIDFETANNERTSVCSVGIVIVRHGAITDSFYSLIQPEPNYYSYFCSRVHGLSHVAHNKAFDEGCLKAVFRCYQMDYPNYIFHDTLRAARKAFPSAPNHQLHTVASLCGYDLTRHHHALADAEACAHIALAIL